MKSKKLILGLTLAITMGLGATAYAASTEITTTSSTAAHQRVGLGRITGMRGYDYVESILKNNLGMTDAEITAWLNSGKTMYTLAEEKGMTEDQFKAALLEERNKAVDKAVSDGTITNEEGVLLKETLKNNLDNCTGTPGQKTGKNGAGRENAQGTGHMSGGGFRGTGNCYIDNTVK
ncbi:hypothetical protein GKZ28_00100 [Clostridium chromiireducens]|uniref:DUF2680 domain-containing protein n=1 Tax=Clostridium chromiireducens TaxID=225345 RepID=A0A964RIE8_9CLOT|nr:hypothetical protein [Clostridium chromiireducens]MVX62102.1 hypothetical protein [Clostridium chromiireducens]